MGRSRSSSYSSGRSWRSSCTSVLQCSRLAQHGRRTRRQFWYATGGAPPCLLSNIFTLIFAAFLWSSDQERHRCMPLSLMLVHAWSYVLSLQTFVMRVVCPTRGLSRALGLVPRVPFGGQHALIVGLLWLHTFIFLRYPCLRELARQSWGAARRLRLLLTKPRTAAVSLCCPI